MDPSQNSDLEVDTSAVTKTSPVIIRLCTRPLDANKDMESSGTRIQFDENSSLNSPSKNVIKLEKMSPKGLFSQKESSDLAVKDPVTPCEKVSLTRSLQLKEKMYSLSTKDVSYQPKAKSIRSPSKSLTSTISVKENFSAKCSPKKYNAPCDNTKAMVDVSKIVSKKQSIIVIGDLIKGGLNIVQKTANKDASLADPSIPHSLVKNCLSNAKSKEKKTKPSSNLQNNFDIGLPVTSKHLLDPRLNRMDMKSVDLPSINELQATDSNVGKSKLELKALQEPTEKSEPKNAKILPFCFKSERNTLLKTEIDSLQSTENLSRKRKRHYRSNKRSELEQNILKREMETAATSDAKDLSAVMSFRGNIKIEEAVSELEISELEQIRAALQQELLQDIDVPSPEVFQSSDLGEQAKETGLEFPAITKNPQSSGSFDKSCVETDQATSVYTRLPNIEEQPQDSYEVSVDQISSFVPKVVDQPLADMPEANSGSSKAKTILKFENTSEISSVNVIKQEKMLADEADPTIDQPPLVMQSSNLLFNDELDNRHGGGGIDTTQISEKEPITKKLKLSCDNKNDQESSLLGNCSRPDSPFDPEDNLVQLDMASNSPLDQPNSEQNTPMEFDILDEFESDDNEPIESLSETDLSADEIDAMLDAGLENGKCISENSKNLADGEHEEKEKVILKVRGRDHFDVLPEGWIEVTHNSGMPIYLHKQSRVCSVSKPYFLGPGSTRKHEIPVSAVPCLHYLRELEKEKSQPDLQENEENINGLSEKPNGTETVDEVDGISADATNENMNGGTENINGPNIPSAKLQSVKDTKESGSLDGLTLREYCKKRFEFQTITVKRFRTWSGRRKHQKQLKQKQRPFLPDSTKLITCPLYPAADKTSNAGNNTKREFIMNPSGKSPVCILHEYVQHTLRVQPKYIFKELESANTPYGAVVMIDGIEYGCGYGSSKKLAKSDAAKSALQILIPKMKMFPKENETGEENQDLEFFDQVRIEDPRVCDLSVKAGQPYPYQILLECLKRNYGMGDTEIEFKMTSLKHQKNEFFMKVGKHQVSVVCKNKRDGKHRSSQAILQQLHPHIKSWGSLLRMYGKGSCKTLKEKKEEEQRITELQSQACANKPNMSILNKLKEEMLKYRERMISKKPIGKLIPERMEFFSTSNSNLNNVEL